MYIQAWVGGWVGGRKGCRTLGRMAGQGTLFHGVLRALLAGRNVLGGDIRTHHPVDKLKGGRGPSFFLQRFDVANHLFVCLFVWVGGWVGGWV